MMTVSKMVENHHEKCQITDEESFFVIVKHAIKENYLKDHFTIFNE